MPGATNNLGETISQRYTALESLRAPWVPLWQEIAKYVMPRRAPGMNGTVGTPSTTDAAMIFDTTAVQANMTLANGQLAWMSPLETPWFDLQPPEGIEDDEAKRWLARATSISRSALARSNFYTGVHEFYLDRSAFGTACLFLEQVTKRSGKTVLNAQCWPVGTFVIDEDADGEVDTVIRSFKLSARNAVQKFGEGKVSEKILKASKEEKTRDDKFEFLHAIYPRENRDTAKRDPANMPIASVYVEKDTKQLVQEGGYNEMPVFVSRYLEWGSGLGSLYGWSPSFVALPEARQMNYLSMWRDLIAEKMSSPPMLAPEELEGEIDDNARGVTYFSRDLAQANAFPRPLNEPADPRGLVERAEERRKAIEQAFHVDLFQMFSQLQKQMTAREVAERASEKLIQFSPTFARLTNELFNPLLERLFSLLLLQNAFGDPPASLIKPIPGTDLGEISTPRVEYASRLALALRSLPSIGYQRTLERLAAVAQLSPDVLDNYDFDKAERATALTDGAPVEFLRPEKERDELRQARAQAQAQQQQMEMAQTAAETASKIGSIRPDSPIAGKIKDNIESTTA